MGPCSRPRSLEIFGGEKSRTRNTRAEIAPRARATRERRRCVGDVTSRVVLFYKSRPSRFSSSLQPRYFVMTDSRGQFGGPFFFLNPNVEAEITAIFESFDRKTGCFSGEKLVIFCILSIKISVQILLISLLDSK